MITGKKEELDSISKTHRCREHDNPLQVAWNKGADCYAIRCGAGHFPEEVMRIPTLTEELKQDILPGGEIAERVKQGAERRAAQRAPGMSTPALGLMTVTDLGTGERLTLAHLELAVNYAKSCDLDIKLGHVCLYHGKPYPTIDGYLYHAHRANKPFKMLSRPLGTEERTTYQVGELDYAWECNIYLVATGEQFSGIGIITNEERTAKSKRNPEQFAAPVVAAKPWQMAQKRAERQALRRAFPLGAAENESSNQ